MTRRRRLVRPAALTSPAPDFADLPRGAQLFRLRHAALDVLARRYPHVEVRRLRLLNHGFNTTFRVDAADGRRFALRLNVNSRRTPANVRAEVAWVAALARDTALPVPRPEPADSPDGGEAVSFVPVPGLSEPRPAVLFSWLPGRELEHALNPDTVSQLGAATAVLHRHAAGGWELPAGTALEPARTVLLNSPPVLWGLAAVTHPDLSDELRDLLRVAWERGEAALQRVWSRGRVPARPLHFDLHPWNLKWHRGRLAVFDFDDSVLGHPVQDLAISLYYLRRSKGWTPAWDAALRAGYEAQGGVWPEDERTLEDLVAARAVLLANDVLQILNPDVRKEIPAFFARVLGRLRGWRQTGRMG